MVDNSIGFGNPNTQPPLKWKGWFSFAAGGLATFLLIYIGIARPAVDELSLLRDQIRSLEKSVAMVAGQRDGVDETNHLLSQLSQQQSQANSARKTLLDLREMTNSLLAESTRFQEALRSINQFVAMKDSLISNSEGIERAMESLTASETLQNRLLNSAESNELALHASLDLLAMRGELLQSIGLNDQAKVALENLVQLGESLNDEGSNVEIARERIDGLISLKDSVISQTNDLSESIETLELTHELSERFRTAAISFKEIRDWMIEIVALEPTFAQVRRILEPMADLVNLNRMDPKQIRDFTRAFVQQSQDRLSSKSRNVVSLRSPSDHVPESPEADRESTIE